MHLYPSAHRWWWWWWVSTLLWSIPRINRCTHAHIQTVVDIDTSFTLWRIPDGFDDLGTRAVKVETSKEKMCEHCRKNSACRGSVCLPSCPIVCKNAQDQAGLFFVFFMLVMPFNFDAQVVGNDISTLNTMTITPSSNVRLQNTHICLPAYLLYPSDTIWPTNLEHLSLYGSLHFATCPLGNARKLVLYSIY